MTVDFQKELAGGNQLGEQSRSTPHIKFLLAESRRELYAFGFTVIVE